MSGADTIHHGTEAERSLRQVWYARSEVPYVAMLLLAIAASRIRTSPISP
jgi:hypothetical protein